MAKTILITGATGRTGGATIKLLLERGLSVRALVRRHNDQTESLQKQGVEIVTGDLLNFDSVRSAVQGADRAYFVFPIRPGLLTATAYFAQAAAEAGLEAIVNMSQISARSEAKSHAAQDHWIGERLLDRSGVPTTHIRPTFFAEWFLYYPEMIREGVFRFPFRAGKHAPIAVSDQGRVIAAVLENPHSHSGKTYPLFGPVEMTHEEIAAVIGSTLGITLRYEAVSFNEFAKAASARTLNNPVLLQHLEAVAIDYENGLFSGTNHFVEEVGGEPPTDIPTFVRDHPEAFR
jgi:NAD(P)H dehydrogenase (quinone)